MEFDPGPVIQPSAVDMYTANFFWSIGDRFVGVPNTVKPVYNGHPKEMAR